MFCVNCGKTVPSDAQFCINCGASVPEAARATATLGAGGSSWSSEPASSESSWSSEPLASTPGLETPSNIPTYGSGPVASVSMPVGARPMSSPLPSGNDPAVLDQLPSWSWAAFLWGWIWCIPHRMYLWMAIDLIGGMFIPLVPRIVLALMANKEAWRNRPVASLAEYNEIQAAWVKWGLILLGLSLLFMVGMVVLVIGVSATSSR